MQKLLTQLQRLVDQGNTVIVVEHDLSVIRSSDWHIDVGPGAGDERGRIVVAGTPEHVARHPRSQTALSEARKLRRVPRVSVYAEAAKRSEVEP